MAEKIKIMLSRPMKGKTRKEIEEEEKEMANILFDKYEGNCEIIPSIIENPEDKSELECFSESIFFMSRADVLAMGLGWENARGCKLEHDIAKAYHVPVMYLEKCMGADNRFMVDDAGTLIDMETRDTYDIVEDVVGLLNDQNKIIRTLGVGVAKIKKGIETDREAQALVLCLEILKTLEEEGYYG